MNTVHRTHTVVALQNKNYNARQAKCLAWWSYGLRPCTKEVLKAWIGIFIDWKFNGYVRFSRTKVFPHIDSAQAYIILCHSVLSRVISAYRTQRLYGLMFVGPRRYTRLGLYRRLGDTYLSTTLRTWTSLAAWLAAHLQTSVSSLMR